jgi:signal transduction histidine kinase
VIGFRRALWALGLGGFVAGLVPLILALGADQIEDRPLVAVFGPLVGWAFIGTGLFAWYRRSDNRFGPLMTAVGFTWCLSGLVVSSSPGVFVVGLLVQVLPYGLLFHMLIAFPSGRLEGRLERLLAVGGYFATTVLQVAIALFVDTTRDDICGGCPENPLVVVDDQSVADALIGVQAVLAIVLLIGVALILTRRWRAAGPSQRQVLGPVLACGAVLVVLLLISLVADLTGFPDEAEAGVDIAGLVALASIPFGFLVGLLRSRFSRATAVSELVASLSDRRDRRQGLRDALADALGDPGLTLAYWLPASGEYVTPEGQPCELPAPGSDRVATLVEKDGAPLAAILHDASLEDERELVRTVAAAATLTLENERLDAEVRAHVEELRASRQRLVDAEFEGRRQLERDLHDGAQQRLVSLALNLRLARSKLTAGHSTAAGELLESAAAELDTALGELRELARGIHPAVLSDRGLDAALQALAARAPLPVEVTELPESRLPDKVESAAYFVVAEALTNVAKYAQASRASIRVVQLNGRVVVEVSDDGIGGADPAKGSGLRGLSDRMSALDGRLALQSEEGDGTTLMAWIPLR